mgnify:CR=1 FL=1
MSLNYDGIDLLWSNTGDLVIGHEGDVGDTSFDSLLAAGQDIYDRCKCDASDYKEAPLVGATISDFTGEPNNAANGAAMRSRLINTLQTYGVFSGSDLSVDTFPVSLTRIAATIQLRVKATQANKNSQLIQQTIFYDYGENHVISGN